MTRKAFVPLANRCHRCQGRRVIVVDYFDYIELQPCPSCHFTPDPTPRSAVEDAPLADCWRKAA